MREFVVNIDDALFNGLQRSTYSYRHYPFLTEAFNVISDGIVKEMTPGRMLVDPFDGGEVVSYPWPSIIRGENITLLAGETSLKEVDETTDPWTAATVTTYDWKNPNTEKAIVSGGHWHMVDMKESWFLFNGSCTVFKTGYDKMNWRESKVYVQDEVQINSGCFYMGRAVIGGFDPENFWHAIWDALYDSWGRIVERALVSHNEDIGKNWIVWSSIGGGDFPLWLFYPATHEFDYMVDEDLVIEKVKLNQFGLMPLPNQNSVLGVAKLGGNVVVYTASGTMLLTHKNVDGFTVLSPVAMYQVGPAGRDAWCASENRHLFVDASGFLYELIADGNLVRHGFTEYLQPLLAGDIRISYSELFGTWRISSSTKGYVKTGSGLFESKQRAISSMYLEGGEVGTFTEADDDEARVVTNALDMGERGLKSIGWINLGITDTANVSVAIDYRYQKDQGYTRTPWVPVNYEGCAFIRASGIDFRVAIKSDNYSNFQLDYIQVRYQSTDRRYVRGVYANQAFSRTGGAGVEPTETGN